jgi:hypothetical protein
MIAHAMIWALRPRRVGDRELVQGADEPLLVLGEVAERQPVRVAVADDRDHDREPEQGQRAAADQVAEAAQPDQLASPIQVGGVMGRDEGVAVHLGERDLVDALAARIVLAQIAVDVRLQARQLAVDVVVGREAKEVDLDGVEVSERPFERRAVGRRPEPRPPRQPLSVARVLARRRQSRRLKLIGMAWGTLPLGVCFRGLAWIQLFSPESSWTLVSISSRHAVVQGPPIGNGG